MDVTRRIHTRRRSSWLAILYNNVGVVLCRSGRAISLIKFVSVLKFRRSGKSPVFAAKASVSQRTSSMHN